MQPNRLGLGLRPPLPSYGQGPSISTLAQQQQMGSYNGFAPAAKPSTTLFVGSISGGITDAFLNQLLSACGTVKSFKRLITPANKPQGFGFAEFEDPDGALRAIELLNGVELPALEDGCANKKLLVKPDEKTRTFLDAYKSQRPRADLENEKIKLAKTQVSDMVDEIMKRSQEATEHGLLDKEKYVIPPHLHDLQEADLPETQRGLVISEIAMFRERAAKREREKAQEIPVPVISSGPPSGPKQREWGKPQQGQYQAAPGQQGYGRGPQGYNKPVGFVRAQNDPAMEVDRLSPMKREKTDAELEDDRQDVRRRNEDNSFRDRERRYEPRERTRIAALERQMARERALEEAQERDRHEMRTRLHVWDDDESDEMFYVDRARWRTQRLRRLTAEEKSDEDSRRFEERETENLRRESEAFLAKQMDEMQALAEEQRKAGLLLDDGAPLKLSVSLTTAAPTGKDKQKGPAAVFGQDEEEDETAKKRKAPLVKLDFSAAESPEKAKERLESMRSSVPKDAETLFKGKIRWDAVTDTLIDRKFEPLVKRLMTKYLGELEDDDLVMFVLEHLKDHKGPQKLVEGLEPVLDEEATELTTSVWRQVIFESMAYDNGLVTERMLVD